MTESKIHNRKFSEIISIRALAREAKMNHMKIFNNLEGRYNSLKASEKHTIVTTIYNALAPIAEKMGYRLEITKITKDPPPERP